MTHFDYKAATLEELADYIEISTSARISQQIIYYTRKDVPEMVQKIKDARGIVKKRKLIRALEAM